MSPSLSREIGQTRPFSSTAEEAHLSVMRTAEVLARGVVELLREYGLTATQYNVLRILRGGPGEGMPCSAIGERMITFESDITRLLDRLQKLGWVERERATDDRRVVLSRITEAGLALLARLDEPVKELHLQRLAGLDEEELRQLIGLLERARSSARAAEGPAADRQPADAGAPARALG